MSGEATSTCWIGTAGFEYEDWKGIVYPRELATGRDRLRYLAEFVDCIEINASFYRVPSVRSARGWLACVAAQPRFRFALKLWQGFTHGSGAELEDRTVWAAFRAVAETLANAGKLLAVLCQFPFWFTDGEAARRKLWRIAEELRGLPVVLEVRHQSFLEPDALALVRALGWSLADLDMPLGKESLRPHAELTGSLCYLRLHGRNRDAWFRKDSGRDQKYDYLYGPQELEGIVARVRQNLARAASTVVIANNHFRGQALANALEILAAILEGKVRVPEGLQAAYPRLSRVAVDAPPPADPGGQGRLF